MKSDSDLPPVIENEEQLDELLTKPSRALVEFIRQTEPPLLILGAGGKMGPSLAVRARRAADEAGHPLDIIAASRFTNEPARIALEAAMVRTIKCDLLDRQALSELPDSRNIIYLVGLKFGTASNPGATWMANTIVPSRVMERYPGARIVALSTANVYPWSEVAAQGSTETDLLTPLGEYSNAAVARERILDFYSRQNRTPVALIRLHYAVELRYGVLVDIARKVYQGDPIDLANGSFSCIWQGDANDFILRALQLAESPPSVWNLCRPEVFEVRSVAERFGELFGRKPKFTGTPSATALLSNPARLCERLGPPLVNLDDMMPWIAGWVSRGGRDLGRPTHFEVRDGRY